MKLPCSRKVYVGLLGAALLACSTAAQALIKCTLSTGAPFTFTVPVSPGALSVGPEMPVGTIMYRGTMALGGVSPSYGFINCSRTPAPNVPGEVFSFTTTLTVSNAPQALSAWNSAPYPGKVYETGIPGVGIAMLFYSSPFTALAPIRSPSSFAMYADGQNVNLGYNNIDFNLIKIGNISPGSFNVNAIQFPTISVRRSGTAADNVVPFDYAMLYFKFSGTLKFTQPTCATPNVSVNLGSHKVTEFATATTTPWIDTSIKLTGCPTFSGYYNNSNYPILFNTTGSTTSPVTTGNQLGLKLTPTSTIIDHTNGIMAVTPAANAATGIGIQIGYGNIQNPDFFDFMQERMMKAPAAGTQTLTIPLAARYIKTSTIMTPGRADGKVTFTINYY